MRPPTPGRVASQVESGVLTTKLQPVRRVERRNCRGSKTMENSPAPFVVALETTFPDPHCN